MRTDNITVRQYRDRVRQCEALGKFAMEEQIRLLATDSELQGLIGSDPVGRIVNERATNPRRPPPLKLA